MSGNGNSERKLRWLRLADGESADLTITSSEPELAVLHWVNGRGVDCPGQDCPVCAAGSRPRRRYRVAIDCELAETWEMSATVWRTVNAVAEAVNGGEIRGLRLRVSRHGTGLSTEYSVRYLGAERPEETEEGWTAAAVQADPQGAKAYALRLCEVIGEDPKQLFRRFLAERPQAAEKPAVDQLAWFIAWLEGLAREAPAPEDDDDLLSEFT